MQVISLILNVPGINIKTPHEIACYNNFRFLLCIFEKKYVEI